MADKGVGAAAPEPIAVPMIMVVCATYPTIRSDDIAYLDGYEPLRVEPDADGFYHIGDDRWMWEEYTGA